MNYHAHLPQWFARFGFGIALMFMLPTRAAMVHQWQFNEVSGTNLLDSVGSANASVVELAGGGGFQLTGSAVRLDGGTRTSADYVQFPADIFDGLTNVTIEIWAEPHSFQNWGRVLDIGPGDSIPNPATDNFRLSFSIGTDGNQQRFGLRPYTPLDSALATATNQVYFYAIVWSATNGAGGGGRLEWYRDGTLVAGQDTGSTNISALANLAQTATWLGRSAYTADSTANASFHAMRIYDTAFDSAGILLHLLKGPDGNGPDTIEGLIHRWSFSDSNPAALQDSVGAANGYVVTPGGIDYALTNGQLRLNGGARATASYVEFPSGLLDGLSDVTVEAWVTPQSAQNWSRLFDFGTGSSTADTFFLSLCRGTSLNQQRLEFGSPAQFTVDTGLPTATNQQYHYVVTWSATGATNGGGLLQWYRDGVLAGGINTAATTIANVDDTVLWLGRSQYTADNTANANFSELRIYDRVLTSSEINFNRITGPDNFSISPPNAVDDALTLNPGAMALIPVLQNDTGTAIDANTLALVTPPTNGTAQIKPGGKVLYTHDGGPSTYDQFSYTVQNTLGQTSDVATVSLTISSSLRLANTTITVPNTPPPVGYQVVDAFPGLTFEDAVALRSPPGSTNQLFVVERRGIISYIPDITAATPVRQVFLDIRDQVVFDNTVEGEMGLLSMDFHPGFASNGIFFAYYIAPNTRFDRLSRFTANPTTLTVDTNTQQVLFSVVDQAFNHNGGDTHFGPDGYLYVSMGDEGDQYNFRQNAQRIDKDFYSGILRLDVDKQPGSIEPTPHPAIPTNGSGQAFYSIPPGNPFVGATNFFGAPIDTNALRAEFWAVGLRHPWRISIDTNGEVWVGDVGQDRYEEVNVATNGGNYGWAYYEGTNLALPMYPTQTTLLTNPPPGLAFSVWEYPHTSLPGGDPQYKGNSISGGVVYHGSNIPELNGDYIFGDFVSANLWALRRTNGSVIVQRIAGDSGMAAFGIDPNNGDVLIANYAQNKVKRLVRTDASNSSFPSKLSDTGIFADLATLTPNPGIVNYSPIVAFWSDYAIKRRWFCIPDLTNTVDFATDANWTFPTGMKWIKHFDLETTRGDPATKKRLETRVLVKTGTGTFGVSYKWNDAGNEAFLVADGGTNFNVAVQDGTNMIQQQWEIPSRAACIVCHTPVGGHALSFNTRELNQSASMNGVSGNQIGSLGQAGYFSAPLPPVNTLPAFAVASDNDYSLEYRVRSYLSVNCVQCHQPGGAGPGTWDARPYLTLAQTGLIDGLPNNNGADPLNKLIVSGDTNHSVVLRRIKGDGFSRMPPLATHQLDEGSIALLTQWIAGELTNHLTFAQWQLANFGSTNSPNAAAAADPDADGANNYMEYLTGTGPQDAMSLWKLNISVANGVISVSYPQVPNLGVVIETSPTLYNWTDWDIPGNQPFFGSGSGTTVLQSPLAAGPQFFRARLIEP